jgi:hypothetical protein
VRDGGVIIASVNNVEIADLEAESTERRLLRLGHATGEDLANAVGLQSL